VLASTRRRESPGFQEVQIWPIDRLIFYARNPRKSDSAVDRMCGSIREFGFKIPVLSLSDGEVVDGHLRLKATRKLGSWPGGDTSLAVYRRFRGHLEVIFNSEVPEPSSLLFVGSAIAGRSGIPAGSLATAKK